MAKKKRSAKQLANDKRLGLASKRRKKSTKKTKSATVKRKSPQKKRNNMAKKKRFTRVKKGFGGFQKSLRTGIVGEVIKGVGAGSVATLVVSKVSPQHAGLASAGAGFLAGGVVGGIANLVINGGLQSLGFGSSSSGADMGLRL